MTVRRFEEIRRRLSEGRGLREIARALGCSRDTVREVRDGLRVSPDAPKALPDPLWMLQVDWPPLIHDLGLGHPLKFLWEERAQHLTTYSNFWKQFYRKFPQYRQASVTAREFTAGERVEVDYAGDPIEWFDMKTGEIHQRVGVRRRARLQPAAVRARGRGHAEPQLARLSSAHVRLLRRRHARARARLLEARRAQVPLVRSGSEPGVRRARCALLHRNRSSASRPSEGQGVGREWRETADALPALPLSAHATHLARASQPGARGVRQAHQ